MKYVRNTALLLALVAGACTQPADELSPQAIQIALRDQETIYLDEAFAREVQEVLERCWEAEPTLQTIGVTPNYIPDSCYVREAPPAVEEAWQMGELLSGHEEVDEILLEYDVSDVYFLDVPETFSLTIGAPVRPDRFAALLNGVEGVEAEPSPYSSDGDNITLERSEDGWEVVFKKGWGDCLAGCISEHHWRLSVPDDSSQPAQLVEEWGDPLP